MVKVIPFKRMYCPDFFQTLHKCQPYIYRTFRNYNEKIGSPCLFLPCVPVYIGEVAMLYVHQVMYSAKQGNYLK